MSYDFVRSCECIGSLNSISMVIAMTFNTLCFLQLRNIAKKLKTI